ncbi:MAG: DMT family transporter [Anaerolineales bacterium]
MNADIQNRRGVAIAISSAGLIGLTPIFGKLAIQAGMFSISVVAARTAAASILLFVVMLLFQRKYLYIFPVGFVGCMIAGSLNGLGSLFFYLGLARVDASLSQMLFSLYPLFVAFLLFLDGLKHSKITLLALLFSIPAVYFSNGREADVIEAFASLLAGLFYALHIPINQRVLYEAPPPTVTLYTLFAMTMVVVPAELIFSPTVFSGPQPALLPLIGLTLVTFFSRLALFSGVKSIGGMRTSLLGLGQVLVTVSVAYVWLGETLTPHQWLGALLLVTALILVGMDKPIASPLRSRGWLRWLSPRFRRND